MNNGNTPQPARPGQKPPGHMTTIARNVATNWLWFGLVMASGLIVPRLIANRQASPELGKELLGVWDLGWSLGFYVGLLSLGLTSAITRYVAHYRALGDRLGLNAVVNTGLLMLVSGALLGSLFAFCLAALTPLLIQDARPEVAANASRVIFMLAVAAAAHFPGTVFSAVIGGCERYDLLNIVRGAVDATVLALMVILLFSGYGLLALAWVVLLVEVPGFSARMWLAHRLCPEMRLGLRHVRWRVAVEMVGFSAKSCLQSVASSALYQLNNILVSVFMGPAAVAVYSRQRVLVLQALRFIRQYAQVFIPSSSALAASGDHAALRKLLVQTSRFGMYFTLPIVLILLVMGRPLVDLWMRPGYAAPGILAIMAVGHLLSVPQQGVYMLLMGMDRHGRPALFDAAGAVLSVVLALLLMGVAGLGMVGGALAMAVPVALMGGVVMPLYACRLLEQDWLAYVRQMVAGPAAANLPFAACLLGARWYFADQPVRGLIMGVGAGALVNAIVYWQWVLPADMRRRLLARMGLVRRGPTSPEAAPAGFVPVPAEGARS